MIEPAGRMLLACLVAATAACLDPLVADDPGLGDQVLPAGTVVPPIADDARLAAQIAANDGVDGVVPRLTGFADGASIHTWDFGPAPSFAAPVYALMRRTAAGLEGVDHATIVDKLPGDQGYSPYWGVYVVVVTERYQGQIIPSVAAIDEAVRRGLVEPPEAQEFAVDCPIVGADVMLEVGGGNPPLPPNGGFYVKGRYVPYYDFGRMPLIDRTIVPEARRYLLRREGAEPLNERVRGVDMTGDGDTHDSNDVFALTVGDPAPTSLCRTTTVAVPTATASIDTTADETSADLRAADQLFAPGPVVGTVLAFEVTDELRHCVLQRQAGGL